MQQQSGRNWWKVFGLTVLIGGGLLVVLIALIVGLVAFSAPTGKDTTAHNEPEAAKEEQRRLRARPRSSLQ